VDDVSRQNLSLARAQVLAVSPMSAAERLDRGRVDAVIRATVRALGGVGGCVAALAHEFGEYPDTAPLRMRWAKQAVAAVYDTPAAATPARLGLRTQTRSHRGVPMRTVQIVKRPRPPRCPAPLDLRTPSGRPLPY
jgi:hypothetical protein